MEHKNTILVVDDTPENIDVLYGVLGGDYKVKVAPNGEKALKIALGKNPPDLILLDIMMPGMDGYEVCRKIKADETKKDIPIIFVTAKSEMEDERKGLDLGAVDYITKPIKPPLLLSRVRTHLELKEQRDALIQMLEMEKELTRTKEDIERITRHDLKTPLNAIISYPQLFEKDNLTEKQIDQLNKIGSAGYKLLNMINLSLDLYKMEQGTYQFNPAPVDILPIFEDIAHDNRNFLRSKRAALDITINGNSASEVDSFEIPGEKLLFYSMFANLVKNALEASPRKEKIAIKLSDNDDYEIVFHNKGAVPEEIRATFFEKYATSGKKSGTGLGTYSARLIAETQSGSISMESSDETGTMIKLVFPKLKDQNRVL